MERFSALPGALLPWYRENARPLPWRADTNPYRVWVSEIMLQQTRVEAVIGYYARFLEAFPTILDLARTDEDKLFKLWEGLGYYSRARNLQKAAQVIVREHGGVFPESYKDIRALPGVGPYTAGAIASICFALPKAAVDGNVLRVAARFLCDSTPVDTPAFKEMVTGDLEKIYPMGSCGTFTQALMELGATVCTPQSPKCGNCPLSMCCRGREKNMQDVLPVKSPKKEKKQVQKTVFLLWHGDELALRRRPKTGLLAGMWELPNVDVPMNEQQALQAAKAFGVKPQEVLWSVECNHIFTHIRWDMVGYTILCEEKNEDFIWKTRAEIRQEYALPTAFRKFLEEEA